MKRTVSERAPQSAPPPPQARSAYTESTPYFLASMSHEIRTPMNSLLGMLELLEMTSLTPEQREVLRVTRDSARTLVRVADDVLDLSKIQSGMIEFEAVPVNVRLLIDDIVALLRAENQDGPIRIGSDIDTRLQQPLATDPIRLRQILLNLACNAIKFTHRGSVTLVVKIVEETHAMQRIRIEVADTGIGMSHEALRRVWQPFAQADASTTRFYGGTGLGLTIAQQLSKRLGGVLTMRSEEGKGTTACLDISLPLACRDGIAVPARGTPAPKPLSRTVTAPVDQDMNTLPAPRARRASVAGSPFELSFFVPAAGAARVKHDGDAVDSSNLPERSFDAAHGGDPPGVDRSAYSLLLADDHPTNRLVMEMQLTRLGYRYEAVDNGRMALDRLKTRPYDLLLTDCLMPEMDGYGLAAAWRRIETAGAFPMAVVGLSANPLPNDIPRRDEAGMDDCLLKPIALDALDTMLLRWLPTTPLSVSWQHHTAMPLAELSLPPVDLPRLEANFGGPAMLTRVLHSFVVTTQEDLALLAPYLKKGDPLHPQCQLRLHRITGGLLVLGDRLLAEQGSALELALTHHASSRAREREQRRVPLIDAMKRFCAVVVIHLDWVIRRYQTWD